MVFCLISNLFIPINQACAITSTLEFGVHRESNVQTLASVETGKSRGFSRRVALLIQLNTGREAWPTELGLGSGPGTLMNFCCVLRLAARMLTIQNHFLPKGICGPWSVETLSVPEVTVHKHLPGSAVMGRERTRSDVMCCLKGRLAVITALLECSFQPPEPSPPPVLICKGLSITHSPCLVGSSSHRLQIPSHFHQRLCLSGHAFSPLNTSNFWLSPV